jgi:hypothetical protein
VDERSIEVFVFCPFKNGMVNVPKLPSIGGKGVQMTEQQPKTPQIIDIVEMPQTQNGSQTPDTAQIEDILQMVDIQPLKRALGENIYLEFATLLVLFL